MMRVLYLTGYPNEAYQRKVDLLADAPGVDLLQMNAGGGIPLGRRDSADGRRGYTVASLARRQLGRPGDPHREWYRGIL